MSLLWFVLGRARSLMVTTIIGFVGVAALIGVAVLAQAVWFGILSRVHFVELLERVDASARVGPHREAAASRRVCLPVLPTGAHRRPALAVRALPETVRHLRDAGRLSPLRGAVCPDPMSRVWQRASAGRMGFGPAPASPGTVKGSRKSARHGARQPGAGHLRRRS